jgi:hypothetical protein
MTTLKQWEMKGKAAAVRLAKGGPGDFEEDACDVEDVGWFAQSIARDDVAQFSKSLRVPKAAAPKAAFIRGYASGVRALVTRIKKSKRCRL